MAPPNMTENWTSNSSEEFVLRARGRLEKVHPAQRYYGISDLGQKMGKSKPKPSDSRDTKTVNRRWFSELGDLTFLFSEGQDFDDEDFDFEDVLSCLRRLVRQALSICRINLRHPGKVLKKSKQLNQDHRDVLRTLVNFIRDPHNQIRQSDLVEAEITPAEWEFIESSLRQIERERRQMREMGMEKFYGFFDDNDSDIFDDKSVILGNIFDELSLRQKEALWELFMAELAGSSRYVAFSSLGVRGQDAIREVYQLMQMSLKAAVAKQNRLERKKGAKRLSKKRRAKLKAKNPFAYARQQEQDFERSRMREGSKVRNGQSKEPDLRSSQWEEGPGKVDPPFSPQDFDPSLVVNSVDQSTSSATSGPGLAEAS